MRDFNGLCSKLQHRYQWQHTEWCYCTVGNGLVTTRLTFECFGQGARGVGFLLFQVLTPFQRMVPPPTSTMPPLPRSPFSSPRVHVWGLLPQQTGRWLQHTLAWVAGASGNSEGLGYQFWGLNKLPLLRKDPKCGPNSLQCTEKTKLGLIDL